VLDHVIEPDETNRAMYDTLFELYLDLYPATRSHAWRLADLQLG
jgi:xylulokinase